jgi:ferredoxin
MGFLWRLTGGWRPSVSISPDLCKRVRSRPNGCRRCLDVCPERAISLGPAPWISDACSECGLCQVACPTEVFRQQRYSDERLFDELLASFAAECPAAANGGVWVHCERAESPHSAAVRLPCLGLLSDRVLVAAALSGVEEVRLLRGRCSSCRLNAGKALLDDAIRSSSAMLEGLGRTDFAVRVEVVERSGSRPLGRRELFSLLSNRRGSEAAAGTSSAGTNGPSRRMHFLRQRLDDSGLRGGPVACEKGLPWGRIGIDEELCTACGVCAAVCTTGAIEQAPEDGHQVLSFKSSACTNCSLCEEACPERAVAFEERRDLADILDDRWKVVARIRLTWCSLCGETLPHRGAEMCPTCDKRRVGALWAGGLQ